MDPDDIATELPEDSDPEKLEAIPEGTELPALDVPSDDDDIDPPDEDPEAVAAAMAPPDL